VNRKSSAIIISITLIIFSITATAPTSEYYDKCEEYSNKLMQLDTQDVNSVNRSLTIFKHIFRDKSNFEMQSKAFGIWETFRDEIFQNVVNKFNRDEKIQTALCDTEIPEQRGFILLDKRSFSASLTSLRQYSNFF